jgi:hypothetical protein
MVLHIAYPSTPHFENFKRDYLRALRYTPPALDPENGLQGGGSNNLPEDDVQLRSKPPRCGTFMGTIKLHGTNASIVYTKGAKQRPQIQARTWVIEEGKDNMGTRALLSKAPLHELVDKILVIHKSETFEEIFIVGEVAGRGIQKGVAITDLEPFFAIFSIRINGNWVDIRDYKSVALPKYRIFNIAQYPTFAITIDFRVNTEAVVEEMEKLTMEVFRECPFGAAFTDREGKKVSGAGEGIVWTLIESRDKERTLKRDVLWSFKTKGEQFSTIAYAPKSRDANLNITPEAAAATARAKEGAVQFAEYALTERRFEQGLEHLLQEQSRKGIPESQQNALDTKLIWAFLKWVVDDTIREERYEMSEFNVNEEDARKECAARARKWFMQKTKEASNKEIFGEE